MLPRRELLQGSRQAAGLEPLIDLAETVLRTWEPCWTPFLAPDLREEAEARLASLSELRLRSEGGHPAAERRRLWLERSETALAEDSGDGTAEGSAAGLMGLEIAGNFLFDPAAPEEFRAALLGAGAPGGGGGGGSRGWSGSGGGSWRARGAITSRTATCRSSASTWSRPLRAAWARATRTA